MYKELNYTQWNVDNIETITKAIRSVDRATASNPKVVRSTPEWGEKLVAIYLIKNITS